LFLSVPGPRGHQAASGLLNTKDMIEAMQRGTLKDALERAVKHLRGWKFQKVVRINSGNDVSQPE
jgi:hypothetical protein